MSLALLTIKFQAGVQRTRGFALSKCGGTSIEYALLGSLIAVTIAGICTAMFSKLSTEYTEIANIFS